MKKKFRLKRNEEIGKLVAKKKCVKNSNYIMYYGFNDLNSNARICISVGKKIGNAVIRNKTKRQVREIVKQVIDFSLKIDIVIVVRQNYLQSTFQENLEMLEKVYNSFINKEINVNEKK